LNHRNKVICITATEKNPPYGSPCCLFLLVKKKKKKKKKRESLEREEAALDKKTNHIQHGELEFPPSTNSSFSTPFPQNAYQT
jgi:hypothetical protein